jgi:hypothetical protein
LNLKSIASSTEQSRRSRLSSHCAINPNAFLSGNCNLIKTEKSIFLWLYLLLISTANEQNEMNFSSLSTVSFHNAFQFAEVLKEEASLSIKICNQWENYDAGMLCREMRE